VENRALTKLAVAGTSVKTIWPKAAVREGRQDHRRPTATDYLALMDRIVAELSK